jgi:MFS family permease
VCFFTLLATFNASNFTVAIKPLSEEFNESSTRTGYLVCFNVLWLGVGNIIWVPLMRVTGKRPVYLAALLLLTAANIWSYEAKSYGSLLAARIISGFAASASDATVPSLVTDLFFVHERGHCMMMFHMALSSGFFLGPLICAWITQEVGWRWTCGTLAAGAGATFLVGFFTIRETSYRRQEEDLELPASAYSPKRSFMANLSVTRGYDKEGSFIRTFLRIVTMVAYPPVLWTGLTVGAFVGW